jgi:D-alanine-D-alanine ligase
LELELLAPDGATRHDLASRLAARLGGIPGYGLKYASPGRSANGLPRCGFSVSSRVTVGGKACCTPVDDLSITTDLRADADKTAPPVMMDDVRLATWMERHARPRRGARAGPAGVERGPTVEGVEVVPRPLGRFKREDAVAGILEEARALGFTVSAETAIHVHVDLHAWAPALVREATARRDGEAGLDGAGAVTRVAGPVSSSHVGRGHVTRHPGPGGWLVPAFNCVGPPLFAGLDHGRNARSKAMAHWRPREALQVVLLHNVESSWDPSDVTAAMAEIERMAGGLISQGHRVFNQPVRTPDLREVLRAYDPTTDVVLNMCEALPGIPRSEAFVTAILDEQGFAYTGSPTASLLLSWDKQMVKRLLQVAGLNTPDGLVLPAPDAGDWNVFPAIVKPAHEHCSLGLTPDSVVMNARELERRVAWVLETFRQPALVEDFIDGREFHVSLWGNGVIEMLPPAEMDFSAFADPHDRLCTYDSKFIPDSKHYREIELRLPVALEVAEQAALERQAVGAYRAIGCRDYGRIDLRMRGGAFFVLDVNPNQDISSETSTASAAEYVGLPYGAMLERILCLACQRHHALAQHYGPS